MTTVKVNRTGFCSDFEVFTSRTMAAASKRERLRALASARTDDRGVPVVVLRQITQFVSLCGV